MNPDDWRSALYNAGAPYAVYRVASQLADVADPTMEASISAEKIGKRVGIVYGLNGGETRVRALLRDAEIHGWHEVVAHGRGAPNRYRLTIGRRWAMAGETVAA
ncbi:hypothetical protein [Gordonia sp. i37]|uniref:hypothetical protein n=1 Tax=Gordonia sp. i37 TaxID=1961707 RepID=UPI0009AE0449|nr:hypothetical protein [Gordonia sp. i37]OPX06298.1 hypothetical protein B1964_28740 [Gordonia sp. i37]